MQKRTKFQIRSDAAKQRWVRDDRKESFWRKHVVAWKLSGQSKRGYCIAHSLCQSSFNAWNREIAIRDRERIASANAAEILSEPSKNPFVPLHLLPDEVVEPQPVAQVVESRSEHWIDILVPGGAVIRLTEKFSAKHVAELYSTLKGQV